jgi:hypothetical protein
MNRERSPDSSVSIATVYGLEEQASISFRGNKSSLLHSVQTGSEARHTSYELGILCFLSGGKAAGA